jgi:eukaryotic-like serine/threonine-protein kinase
VAGKGSGAAPGEYQQITFRTGSIGNARFTPDGSIVYSASWEGGETSFICRARTIPARANWGSRMPSCFRSPRAEKWRSASTQYAYHGGYARSGTLARVPLSGGTPREVLDNVQDADWSANGDSMAVVRYVPENNHWRLEYPDRQGADRQHQLDESPEDFAGWQVDRLRRP